MIKHIIFDADDTLYDYQKAEEIAKSHINDVLKTHGIEIDAFWNRFNRAAPVLFRQFADGSITRDEYRIRRFADVLQGSHEKFRETNLGIKSYLHSGNHSQDRAIRGCNTTDENTTSEKHRNRYSNEWSVR